MEKIEEFGVKLKRIRKAAGFSIVGLATQSGLNPQTIKDIEAGRSEAGIKSLTGLARAFKVSIEQLQEGTVDQDFQAPQKLTPKKVLRMYLSIPDDVVPMLEDIGPEHPVWEIVRGAYDQRVKSKAKAAAKGKPA